MSTRRLSPTRRYAAQGSNPGRAGFARGHSPRTRHSAPGTAVTHTLEPRLGQGKDMCLPQEVIYAVDTYRGNQSTFGAYVECMRAHSESLDKHGRATSYTLAGFEGILPEEVC